MSSRIRWIDVWISLPATTAVPLVAATAPVKTLINVVLPAPYLQSQTVDTQKKEMSGSVLAQLVIRTMELEERSILPLWPSNAVICPL